jgi:integrase/recombinase XerD
VSRLRQAVEDYLQIRRALGYKLATPARLLADLVADLEQAGSTKLSIDLALAWACKPSATSPAWWAARLSVARGFASYLATLDPATEVPPADLLPHRTHRRTPRPYSDADTTALLAAAATLTPPLRAATYTTLFGLLVVSGLRVGEAIRLGRDDIDFDLGLLTVTRSKFNKSRQLPLHRSTVTALDSYARRRDRLCPHPKASSFFVSTAGTRLIYNNVRAVFLDLTARIGIGPGPAGQPPRIHDLRHGFAVATLLDWYQAGLDVDARLPLLSAYLGHAEPAATYWYLQAAPALLTLAAERLDNHPGTRP